MKFGGSSLATKEKRIDVINIIQQYAHEKVLVVVSAMGRYPDAYATETLRSLISTQVTVEETSRVLSVGEMISSVVLSNELVQKDVKAISLSCNQISLHVNEQHFVNIDTDLINTMFETYDVVIVPGFQGVNSDNELCTLELGDSDYSAVYIAKAVGCNEVYIYSDVCGIYTADPKHVPTAKLINQVSYNQAKDLAKHKARIICYKALVEGASSEDFTIYLASTFIQGCCTKISNEKSAIKTMSIDFDYTFIVFDEEINTQDRCYLFEEVSNQFVVKTNDLAFLKTPYTKLGCYAKIHFVGCDLGDEEIYCRLLDTFCIKSLCEEDSYYVYEKSQKQDIILLHDVLVRGD